MSDIDLRLSRLLAQHLEKMLTFFAPVWVPLIDFKRIDVLNTKASLESSDGSPGVELRADLLIRVRRRGLPITLLIHVEIEADDSLAGMLRRMSEYFVALRKELRKRLETAEEADRIVPLVVFVKAAYGGVGTHVLELKSPLPPIDAQDPLMVGETTMLFRFNYIGLQGFEASKAIEQGNVPVAALVGLMKMRESQRAELKAAAANLIVGSGEYTSEQKNSLAETLDWFLMLTGKEQEEFETRLRPEVKMKLSDMNLFQMGEKQGFQMGEKQGFQQGAAKTLRGTVLKMGRKQLGEPTAEQRQRLEEIADPDRLERLVDWLLEHPAGDWNTLLTQP